MAVSGRKISDFKGSVSTDAVEDFAYSCVPCLSDDQLVEAHGFCADCQEYLCKTCLLCHKKTKASKHHQLHDIDQVNKHSTTGQISDVCTEKCPTHRNEVITFFCPKHEELGCTDCMIMKHTTCDIEYIPDICTGIGGSKEYMKTMSHLERKLKEADVISKEAIKRNQEIDIWHDEMIRDITKVRKEIDDHLDKLQEKIEADVANRKTSYKQEVDAVIDDCATLSSNIKKLQSNLIENKQAKQNGDLFIAIKRMKPPLHSEQVDQDENVLGKMMHQQFECNKALENILSIDSFGQLTECSTSVVSASKILASHAKLLYVPKRDTVLSHKEEIHVRTQTDSRPCIIYGCALLSSDKLVLADYWNKKLKVVNTLTKSVVDEKSFDSIPYDVAVLPEDQVAVTMPDKKEILIMRTHTQLSTFRSIKVQGRCRCITYHQDHLYVVCIKPSSVLIMDTNGNVKKRLSLKNKPGFENPWHIALSQNSEQLYISCGNSNVVGSITLQGEISAKYNDIRVPSGLLMLDDESLLVCSYTNNSIFQLHTNSKQSQQIGAGLKKPSSVCYSPEKREVYVGGECYDQLKVFSL